MKDTEQVWCMDYKMERTSELVEKGWALAENLTNQVCNEGVLMTSQLHHFFQASQAVHGADNITNPPF